jgi:16S rRNA (uracil1498-N3)-methyltransferase
VQRLQAERSVLRLAGERADKRRAHWQGIVRAASEQCGRGRLMEVAPLAELQDWLRALPPPPPAQARWLLSLAAGTQAPAALPRPTSLLVLSGPEGGWTAAEEAAAAAAGFVPVTLGPRVLRADTAPLALLAWAGLAL